MADILICHSRKNTDGTNNINAGSAPLSVSVSEDSEPAKKPAGI